MFGCVGCYLRGRLVVVLADRREPWQGILVPTEREFHAELRRDFPGLRVHPVLGKWLYLPHASEAFPDTALALVDGIAGGDTRIGVEPEVPALPRRRGRRGSGETVRKRRARV